MRELSRDASLADRTSAINELQRRVRNLEERVFLHTVKPEITLEKVIEFLKKMHFESFGGKGGSG